MGSLLATTLYQTLSRRLSYSVRVLVLCMYTVLPTLGRCAKPVGDFSPLASARLIPTLVLITTPGAVSPPGRSLPTWPWSCARACEQQGHQRGDNGGPLPYECYGPQLTPIPFVFTHLVAQFPAKHSLFRKLPCLLVQEGASQSNPRGPLG